MADASNPPSLVLFSRTTAHLPVLTLFRELAQLSGRQLTRIPVIPDQFRALKKPFDFSGLPTTVAAAEFSLPYRFCFVRILLSLFSFQSLSG
jgi:hypothetical protein